MPKNLHFTHKHRAPEIIAAVRALLSSHPRCMFVNTGAYSIKNYDSHIDMKESSTHLRGNVRM